MNFPERHTHKWARNLKEALRLAGTDPEKMYSGDLEREDKFPGLRMLTAFWISADAEMRLRYRTLDAVLGTGSSEEFEEIVVGCYEKYIEDFKGLASEFVDPDKLDGLLGSARDGDPVAKDWHEELAALNEATVELLPDGAVSGELLERWLDFSLRAILSWSKHLILQAVTAGLFVRQHDSETLGERVAEKVEWFGWEVNRLFFRDCLPRASYDYISDVVSLGSYGMLADQDVETPEEGVVSLDGVEHNFRESYFSTCQLHGIFSTVEKFMQLEAGSLTSAYCPFCVGHGEKTMHFVVPPNQVFSYELTEGLGYGDPRCGFRLATRDGEDDERAMRAQMLIFGDEEVEV